LVLLGVTIFLLFVELLGGRYSDEDLLFVIMTIVYLLYAYLAYRIGGALRHHEVWGESGRVMRLAAGDVSTSILFVTAFSFYAEMVVDAFGWDRSFEMPLSFFLNIFYIIFQLFVLVRAYQNEEDSAATMVIRWFS